MGNRSRLLWIAVLAVVTGGVSIALRPPAAVAGGPCDGPPFLRSYASNGALEWIDADTIRLSLPVNLHQRDCGAPDCYGHSISLVLELEPKNASCFLTGARARVEPGGCGYEEAAPYTSSFVVSKGVDLASAWLGRVELRDASRNEAVLLLRSGYFFYEDVRQDSPLIPALPPNEEAGDCCYGYTSSELRLWEGPIEGDLGRVTMQGFHGVRIGMTLGETSQAYGASLEPASSLSEDERGCYDVFPDGTVGSVSFMIVDDRVARVDVTGPGILTEAGVGVGALEADVHAAYGSSVQVSAHPYAGPEGHYLRIEDGEGRATLFETDGRTVTSYRAGRAKPVGWIEGCL